MREIQATEAKTHLARRRDAAERAAARSAIVRFRARRSCWGKAGVRLGEILDARHHGHRA